MCVWWTILTTFLFFSQTFPSAGKLIQRWIFKTVSCCTINQTTPTRLYNTNITLDICSIIQSTAICLFADCHAIFYLRNYWHAGIFHFLSPSLILFHSNKKRTKEYLKPIVSKVENPFQKFCFVIWNFRFTWVVLVWIGFNRVLLVPFSVIGKLKSTSKWLDNRNKRVK